MIKRTKLLLIPLLTTLLTACCGLECVGPVNRNIKPYIAYWEKTGMTEEGRLRDWMGCGGQANGTYGYRRSGRLPDESEKAFEIRQEHAFQRCMIRAGYRYTGSCSSDWAKSRPQCGAP